MYMIINKITDKKKTYVSLYQPNCVYTMSNYVSMGFLHWWLWNI